MPKSQKTHWTRNPAEHSVPCYEDPPEIKALTNETTARKYINLMREHDNNIEVVAEIMSIKSETLRLFAKLKREFIASVAREESGSKGIQVI